MEERQVRACFAAGWSFKLFSRIPLPYLVTSILLAAAIWLAGALVAAILGVLPLFIGNLLAYPIGIALALAAYGWFASALPKILAKLYPALNLSAEEYIRIIKKWANRLYNHAWAILLISLPIMILMLASLITFWSEPGRAWLGSPWTRSDQNLFFAIYYGIYTVPIASFLLANGIAGILMSLSLLRELLDLPLKLAYYRQLGTVVNLSAGLSFWTLIAFIFVGILPAVIAPEFNQLDAASNTTITTIALAITASALLFAVLFAPVMLARQAIINAKHQQIAGLQEAQQQIYQTIQQLTVQVTSALRGTPAEEQFDQVRKHLEHLELLDKLIKEIETIPNSPITWGRAAQLSVAAITPIFGVIINDIVPKLIPKIF